MIRSSAGMPRVSKTLRYALSGAAMSLALAALSSPGQAVTFFCDDDLVNRNFTCGSAATTAGSTFSTAVGDSASATEGGGTAVGTSAVADGGGSTAVGTAAVASGGGSTAVGHSSQAIGESSIAVGFQAVAGFHDSTHNLSNSGATAIGTNAEAGTGGLGQDNATAVGQGGGSQRRQRDSGRSAGIGQFLQRQRLWSGRRGWGRKYDRDRPERAGHRQ